MFQSNNETYFFILYVWNISLHPETVTDDTWLAVITNTTLDQKIKINSDNIK